MVCYGMHLELKSVKLADKVPFSRDTLILEVEFTHAWQEIKIEFSSEENTYMSLANQLMQKVTYHAVKEAIANQDKKYSYNEVFGLR